MSGQATNSIDGVIRGEKARLAIRNPRGWPSTLRPCAPALIALAVLVFLWGLGYKLSLYHHATKHASLTTVAKLWTEPRAPRLSPATLAHIPHWRSATLALFVMAGWWPQLRNVAAMQSSTVLRRSDTLRSLIPPRSPPAFRAS